MEKYTEWQINELKRLYNLIFGGEK